MAKFVKFEKPIPHISLSEWYTKQWELRQSVDVRKSEACQLRNSSKTTRSEGTMNTKWNTYISEVRIADRILEVSRWKDILEDLLIKLINEMHLLRDDRVDTEKEIESVTQPLRITSECMSLRNSRRGTELTYDEVDIELKKELDTIMNIHEELTKKAQAIWEKLNHLEAFKFKLSLDIEDKNETIKIDKDNFELDHTCANLSYKPKTIDKANSITYEAWLDKCNCLKSSAENELSECYTFREALHIMKEYAWNDIKAQQDVTNYTLRKRIYQTQKARNELEWQKLKTQKEMEMLMNEIQQLEETLMSKTDVVKCVETRLQNRVYRPGAELCKDKVEFDLKNEALQLQQTEQDLTKMIEHTKASYNNLECLLTCVNKNLEDKQHSLNTDVMCLDMRMPLKTEDRLKSTNETDRNIILTRLEKELPPQS